MFVGVQPPVLELDALLLLAAEVVDAEDVAALVLAASVLVALIASVVLVVLVVPVPPLPPVLVAMLDSLVSSSAMSEVEPVAQAATIPNPSTKRNE